MRVIDSHTEGEPTRVIVSGGPDLGGGTLVERRDRFRDSADHFRRMAIHEPRGYEALVGALLCEPTDTSCVAGVIFFNNTGYLNMCGHGAIGVAITLAYLGRIQPGIHRLETPVGIVPFELLSKNEVAIENVPSYRHQASVSLEVAGLGTIRGDVAWGGNWFFLTDEIAIPLMKDNLSQLSDVAANMRSALAAQGITGADGAEIDHLEFFAPAESADADSRNFVYCPGGAYDRSPCGTGTSAKLACLAADGKLAPGETWVQESIIGSRFTATYRMGESSHIIPRIVPHIVGRAFVCSEAQLLADPDDPYAGGIP